MPRNGGEFFGHAALLYSPSEIARIMSRARRLEEARIRFAPQMG